MQESSVQEEVEMMVESLLDVLLQTLLSIMSKSHSVETSRGQRCPQCTAEITVSFPPLMCNRAGEYFKKKNVLKQVCLSSFGAGRVRFLPSLSAPADD